MPKQNLDNKTDIQISDENISRNSCTKYDAKFKYPQSNLQICRNLEEMKNKELENMKQQLKIYRKRVECLLKMNCQFQSELNESIQKNLQMEQCITCPYIVKDGEIEFPGKNDLDKHFDWLFTMLMDMKNDLKTVQNNNNIIHELDHILHLKLPKCYDKCHNNFNEI